MRFGGHGGVTGGCRRRVLFEGAAVTVGCAWACGAGAAKSAASGCCLARCS